MITKMKKTISAGDWRLTLAGRGYTDWEIVEDADYSEHQDAEGNHVVTRWVRCLNPNGGPSTPAHLLFDYRTGRCVIECADKVVWSDWHSDELEAWVAFWEGVPVIWGRA